MDSLQLCLLICAVATVVYVSQSGVAGTVVLGTTNCTTDANCSGVANAKCDAGKVCNCADSYKQANTSACILNGINDACTATKDCSSANHLTCSTNKCVCDAAYKPGGAKCIPKVIGQACTNATQSTVCTLKNSVCSGMKCACAAGYKNTDDTCSKESSAASLKIPLSTLGIFMMLNVILKMF